MKKSKTGERVRKNDYACLKVEQQVNINHGSMILILKSALCKQ